jgi:transcriptional regulator with XRE-family HTH domain
MRTPESSLRDVPAIRRALGANIRSTRRRAGLTQVGLERKSYVPRTMISKLERGEQEARISTLAQFAVAMRVPLMTFLEGLDDVAADAIYQAGRSGGA